MGGRHCPNAATPPVAPLRRFTFGGLVRVYKHFDFNLHDPDIRLTGMSFSSYPG